MSSIGSLMPVLLLAASPVEDDVDDVDDVVSGEPPLPEPPAPPLPLLVVVDVVVPPELHAGTAQPATTRKARARRFMRVVLSASEARGRARRLSATEAITITITDFAEALAGIARLEKPPE
jgi:hypothetical protein